MENIRACGDGYVSYDEHPGYDFYALLGTEVKAAAAGKVIQNGAELCINTNLPGGCSAFNYVGIDHGNGYITQYGHLSRIDVVAGEIISQGQHLGLSGYTGLASSAAHLHFEVLRLIPGLANHYNKPLNYAVVDPFGWTGPGLDPLYSFSLYRIPPMRLWQ
jgi:murein DD-endopeptidase MepM/ murein hydrolase activator NlpD